jgi:hypothetical protein
MVQARHASTAGKQDFILLTARGVIGNAQVELLLVLILLCNVSNDGTAC